jgi:hypothetical protein
VVLITFNQSPLTHVCVAGVLSPGGTSGAEKDLSAPPHPSALVRVRA